MAAPLAPPASLSPWPPPSPSPSDDGGVARKVAGPMSLLLGLGVAVLLSVVFRRSFGDVACAWRVSYSPYGRVFVIWPVIFAWTLVSIAYQLSTGWGWDKAYAAQPWNNMLNGLAFFGSGMWLVVFSCSRNADARSGLVVSASFLLAVTWCAVGAAVQEASWRRLDPYQIVGIGVPFALFAGWTCVASALGVGVAVNAILSRPDYRCFDSKELDVYDMMTEANEVDQSAPGSWVPLVLSFVVGGGALLVPDPVLPIPLAIAVYHMKGHMKNRLALYISVSCVCVAGALAFLEKWLF